MIYYDIFKKRKEKEIRISFHIDLNHFSHVFTVAQKKDVFTLVLALVNLLSEN